jgi:hypothetical protein
MKIAFVCACLEPGRDGVGDYTRRLAGELIRQGCQCAMVALNDPYVKAKSDAAQEIEGIFVSMLRLPESMPWDQRMNEARDWMKLFDPNWVSLQFVPFGFHPKGLRFGLGAGLAIINSRAPWQVMFHELWLGLGEGAPFKHHIWGALQKHIVRDFLKRLHPRIVHTQAEVYRITLEKDGIKPAILPLFSNIPFTAGDGWNSLLKSLVTQALGKTYDRNQLYLAGVLGAVHPEWDVEVPVNTLLPLVQKSQKKLVLVFHGKNNLSPEIFQAMKLKLQGRADIVVAGERSGAGISRILQTLDIGLATSPRQMIQKSGSVAAMFEHGLPVLVTREDWRLRGAAPDLGKVSARLFTIEQFAKLEALPVREEVLNGESGVKRVARQMLSELK